MDVSSRGRQRNIKNSDSEAYFAFIRDQPEASPTTAIGITWRRHFSFSSEGGEEECAALLSTRGFVSVLNALPNGFYQAVSAGLPMVHSPLPEIAALAERYELGLAADQSDPAEVAAQVGRLASDREALALFRANSERAAGELTWEREEQRLAEVVEGVMGIG